MRTITLDLKSNFHLIKKNNDQSKNYQIYVVKYTDIEPTDTKFNAVVSPLEGHIHILNDVHDSLYFEHCNENIDLVRIGSINTKKIDLSNLRFSFKDKAKTNKWFLKNKDKKTLLTLQLITRIRDFGKTNIKNALKAKNNHGGRIYEWTDKGALTMKYADIFAIDANSPLKKAKGAIVIDTTHLTIKNQVNKIIRYVNIKQSGEKNNDR
jgi:hypothetical protein